MSLFDLYMNPAQNMGQQSAGQQTMGRWLGPQASPFPWQQQQQSDPNAPPQGFWSGSQFNVPGIPNLATPQVPQFGQSQPSMPSPRSFAPPAPLGNEGADSPNANPMAGVDVPDQPATLANYARALAPVATPLQTLLSMMLGRPTPGDRIFGMLGGTDPALQGIMGDANVDPGGFDMSMDMDATDLDAFGEAGPADFGTTGTVGEEGGFDMGDPFGDPDTSMDMDATDLDDGEDTSDDTNGDDTDPGDEFHKGGHVKGNGEIKAKLRAGEYVVKKSAVDHYGVKYFDRLNSMKMKR